MRRQPETATFLAKLHGFLAYVLPRYVREGKSYLTIAVGCTGGRHRSVMIANALGADARGAGAGSSACAIGTCGRAEAL